MGPSPPPPSRAPRSLGRGGRARPGRRALLIGAVALALGWPVRLGAASPEDQNPAAIEEYSAAVLQQQLDMDLGEELGGDFPELRRLLGAEAQAGQLGGAAEAGRRALGRLLQGAPGASAGRRAVLMLAADSLLRRFPGGVLFGWKAPRGRARPRAKAVAGFRLTYRWGRPEAAWIYQRTLLWDVWRTAGITHWGELAFALLLLHGWDTSGACAEGPGRATAVIQEGERFLAGRPRSLYRPEVLIALAQAYETRWSLAAVSEPAGDPARTRAREAAVRARAKTMEYYALASEEAADTLAGQYAAGRLAAIRSGGDRARHLFGCPG